MGRTTRSTSSRSSIMPASQDGGDDRGKMLPLAPGRDQRPPSLGRQAVDPPPGPAPLGGLIVPLGGDQPPALQTVKRRIDRALLKRQGSRRSGIEPAADVPAMRRAVLKHGQNQALEMPPQLVSADGFHTQYLDRLSSGVKGIAWKKCDGQTARERRICRGIPDTFGCTHTWVARSAQIQGLRSFRTTKRVADASGRWVSDIPEPDEWRVVEIGAGLFPGLDAQAPLGNSRLRGIDHERE